MSTTDQEVLQEAKIDLRNHEILTTLFVTQVEDHPQHSALIFQNETLTYSELNSRSNQIAHYLRELNDNNKTLIAICMKPSLDLLVGIIGILKAGCAYVPLDPNNPVSRLRFILEDTKTHVILTHSSELGLFEHVSADVLCFDTQQEVINRYPNKNLNHINQPNDLAYVIYTSGSTGTPKGVLITHANVLCFINWYSKALSVVKEDIFDFSSSVSFDFAVANTLFPLMYGATIAICSESIKKDPYLYLDHLQKNKVTIVKTTPSHFRNIKEVVLEEKKELFVRYMVFGGDSLFVTDIKEWLDQFPKQTMFCEYGPTEATVATSWIKVDKHNIDQIKNKIPIGKPALNTQLYILDGNLKPVPVGEIAELYIGGAGVAMGYLNRKEITAERFIQNPFNNIDTDRLYKTGDYCRFLEDGNIEFIERIDNQVKIRGYRIEMEEIETLLMAHLHIKEAVVIAKKIDENPIADKQLIAYCVPKPSAQLDVVALRSYLKNVLPEHMIPSFFEILPAFPLSSNGKIDRLNLPEFNRRILVQETIPCTELEQSLKIIWEEALFVKHINVHDNFFDLGGNSLTAARILTKVRQTIKKDISLQDFYHNLTISELAQVISSAAAISEIQTTHVIDSIKTPLSELQFLFWLMRLFYPKAKVLNITNRKRLNGVLDINLLNTALNLMCNNHSILSYQTHRFSPLQNWRQLPAPKVVEFDLKHLSAEQQEQQLTQSLERLQYVSWGKNDYLFEVRLFHMGNELTELHLAISHFISDELSSQLFLTHLSRYYLALLNKTEVLNNPERKQFKEYVIQNNIKTKNNVQRDINFWESYLHDTTCVTFSQQQMTQKQEHLNTSYTQIPEELLQRLNKFCTTNRLCITDTLTAAVGLSLTPFIKNKKTIINLVNSTRDQDVYDEAIGLFIRSDVLKVDVTDSPDFLTLSHEVQKSITETATYQTCPTIVKLGCLFKQESIKQKVGDFLSNIVTHLYSSLFPKYQLNHRVLNMFLRVSSSRTAEQFFINMNIMNSFVTKPQETQLFNLNLEQVPPYQSDKTVDKNILNIWFYRDSENKANMILSGNLKMTVLESLSKDIIHAISNALDLK